MASESHGSNVNRRTVLGTIGSTVGASTMLSRVAGAVRDTNRTFVGKAYDPVTEKEQGDASAVLNWTPNGVKGKLDVAGFNIPFGNQGRLTDENSHPRVETYSFVADEDRFTVEENGRELPLVVRIDMLDDRVSGTVKRPGSEYGSLAFSLNPADQGFTSEDVSSALQPERRNGSPANEISMPEEGIPKSNSIRNVPVHDDEKKTNDEFETSEYIRPGDGSDGETSENDVGFLDTESVSNEVSESFPERCNAETADSSWTYHLGTSAEVRYNGDGSLATDYDEIAAFGGYKRFQMQAHFSEPPDRYILECDQEIEGIPYQTGIEFTVHQIGGTTQNEASIDKPSPDETNTGTNPDDGLIGLALNIVSDVTGVYGSVGSTLIQYALTEDVGDGISVDYDNRYSSGGYDQEEYSWDIPLDASSQEDDSGNNYFPDHTDNVAAASFKVENGLAEGKEGFLETKSRFEFAYLDYIGDGDICPCHGASTILKTVKTETISNIIVYRSVEP